MRGLINDGLRWLLGAGILALSLPLTVLHRTKIHTASIRQRFLRRRYGLTPDTPVVGWSPAVERSLYQCATRTGRVLSVTLTSGSSGTPKRVPYTARRLRAVKLAYADMFVRACRALRLRRTSLCVFGSLTVDRSLSSLLLHEHRLPLYLSTLQAPYRVQCDPSMLSLAATYGSTALRLWILTIANPGVLYSTNPSTLSVFFDDLASDWIHHSRLVQDFHEKPEVFDPAVHAVARRLDSRGAIDRLARVAASSAPLPLHAFAPAVEAYLCWTGGYVKPFLDRLEVHLPPGRYRRVPMYSMATEVIETVTHFVGSDSAFLPLAGGVCYEFIEEGAEDCPRNLRTADQLRVGTAYTMVVSDRHGLCRYQTGDVFLCRGFVDGLPDLEFLRRRNLEYSFTGEKLTAQQLSVVFQRLRDEFPELRPDDFLTCVPSWPPGEALPHYKLVVTRSAGDERICEDEEVARRCDRLLGDVNSEYKAKRETGRLAPIRVVRMSWATFAECVAGPRHEAGWENQVKSLPLLRHTWESFEPWESSERRPSVAKGHEAADALGASSRV